MHYGLIVLLASKNIQPIRSCQVTSRVMIQVQPCGIGNEEIVARKKGEHYMGSYKTVCMFSWAVKEKITWTYHMTKRQRIQIQIQKNGQAVTSEVYIRSNQSKQYRHIYIQNQLLFYLYFLVLCNLGIVSKYIVVQRFKPSFQDL